MQCQSRDVCAFVNTRPSSQGRSTIEQRAGAPVTHDQDMNWLGWLGLAVIVTAVVAVLGIQPRDSRRVAHTRMMGMARFVLLGVVVILAYLAFRWTRG